MITLTWVYALAGAVFAVFAGLSLHARRWGNGAFWGLLAASMWGGDAFGDLGNGALVLALVAIAASGLLKPAVRRERDPAARFGNGLFAVALIIPVTALAGTFVFKALPSLADPKQATLISLALGVVLALGAGYVWLKPRPLAPLGDGLQLMDTIGWAALLPQMLASLGAVFALAGVGDVVGGLVQQAIPEGSLLGAVIAFGLGMALFTMVMGNAFAAFPVMTAAIGLPLLIRQYHGDPAVVCAIGMLAGFCGTLMTPMAANFNLVPAGLLELKDRYGVIRAQVATALPLLGVNIAFIYWFAFP
ncbi:MAG: DUF979 domain-containing protein [Novosphingobium sp.]